MATKEEALELLRAEGHFDLRAAGIVKADAPVEPVDLSSFLKLGSALNSGSRGPASLAMDNIMAQFGQKSGLAVADLAARAADGDTDAEAKLAAMVRKTGQMSGAMVYTPEPDAAAAASAGFRHAAAPYVPDWMIDSKKAAVDAASYKQTNPIVTNASEIATSIVPQAAIEYALLRGGRAAGLNRARVPNNLEGVNPAAPQIPLGGGVPMAGPAPILAATGAGAITGGLKSYDEGGNVALGAAQGGGLGFLGGAAGAAVTWPGMKAPSRQPLNVRNLNEEMYQRGYWVNPGLVSGSARKQMLDNAIKSNPKTAGFVDDLMENNQTRFNMEVAQELGVAAPIGKLEAPAVQEARDLAAHTVHTIDDSVRPAPYRLDTTIPDTLRADYLAASGRRQLPPGSSQHAALWRSLDTGGRVDPQWADRADGVRTILEDARDRAVAANRLPLADYYNGLINSIPTPRGLTPEMALQRRVAEEQHRIAQRLLKDRGVHLTGDVNPSNFLRIAPETNAAQAARFLGNQKNSFRSSFIMTNAASKELGRTHGIIPSMGYLGNIWNYGQNLTGGLWFKKYLTSGMDDPYDAAKLTRRIMTGGLLAPAVGDRND
jgi:hypothetical protein